MECARVSQPSPSRRSPRFATPDASRDAVPFPNFGTRDAICARDRNVFVTVYQSPLKVRLCRNERGLLCTLSNHWSMALARAMPLRTGAV